MNTIHAHDWEILKGERIRRWPSASGGLREIRVEISSWVGMSAGAKHTNVTVVEEDNQWWCEDENAWVSLSCDAERGGYDLRASVFTKEEAIKVAKHFLRLITREHPNDYEVNWNGPGKPRNVSR